MQDKQQNSFSKRWTVYRSTWNKLKSKFYTEDTSDECALQRDYYYNHKNGLENLNINGAYKTAFFRTTKFSESRL